MRHCEAIAHEFAKISVKAARPIMEIYARDCEVREKDDRSPVTEADTAAEAIIVEELAKVLPGVPILAEESFCAGVRPDIEREFLLVDPLDGTREFLKKNDEFTVNIALIDHRAPVAGCVYAPALGRIYVAAEHSCAADLQAGRAFVPEALHRIHTRPIPQTGISCVMSRSHCDDETRAFAEAQHVKHTISAGSSLKFCRVAEGQADLYPRFGPTMEWDTAAGHAVVNGAGGTVTRPDGSPFLYGKSENEYRNGPFVAWSTREARLTVSQ